MGLGQRIQTSEYCIQVKHGFSQWYSLQQGMKTVSKITWCELNSPV